MARIFKIFAASCAGVMLLSVPACGGNQTVLGKPDAVVPLSYTERREKGEAFDSLLSASNAFAARFAPKAAALSEEKNVALSPISVYMALALAAQCASGETASELYTALGAPRETVTAEFSDFYRSLAAEYTDSRGKVEARVDLGNSIWVNKGTTVRENCIQTLATDYHCHSYAADFVHDNAGANKAVQNFVKEQTHGLIDRDFKLSDRTLFALINTLYLKEIWNSEGDELPLTQTSYSFKQGDGSEKSGPLMQGKYVGGRAFDGGNFTSFFTRTLHGYKLHFLVPKEGVPLAEVFTEETLNALQTADYGGYDEETDTYYSTRCLFPAYEANFDEEVDDVLKEMGVERFFRDPGLYPDGCEFETLTDELVYCKKVQHVAKLKVERRGIEGAAVTVVGMDAAEAAPIEYVYEDFIVDRAFGFVLTDPYGVTLFSGVVNTI